MGAGFEKSNGKCGADGLPTQEHDSIDIHRRTMKLKLKRTTPQHTQTSIDLLRPWRGNCDVQLLTCHSSPDNIDVQEMSRAADCVAGHIGKGNSTRKEEAEALKRPAVSADEVTGDENDLRSLTNKMMNQAAARRLIPKQEACALLANMKLTHCSDLISTASISQCKRLSETSSEHSDSFLAKCAGRRSDLDKSLAECFHIDRKQQRKPAAIPRFTGLSGAPTFPVTEAHARQTLVLHKPWKQCPDPPCWMKAFNNFINSKLCPVAARMAHDRVMLRHCNGTKLVEPTAHDASHNDDCDDEEDEAAAVLAGLDGKEIEGIASTVFDSVDRGSDFKWDNAPMERSLASDVPAEEWLQAAIGDARKELNEKPCIPKKEGGSNCELDDLFEDQLRIATAMLNKLEEWLHCTDFSKLEPLRCTISGKGGTGKSVLLNTITSVIRRKTGLNNSCLVAAPTGTAAFNANGETTHGLMGMTCDDNDAGFVTLSSSRKGSLTQRFKDCLVLVFDERSICFYMIGHPRMTEETFFSGHRT